MSLIRKHNRKASGEIVRVMCENDRTTNEYPVPQQKTYKFIWADDAELHSLDESQWACAVAGGRSVHPVYSQRRVLPRHAALSEGTALNGHREEVQDASGDRNVSEAGIPTSCRPRNLLFMLYSQLFYLSASPLPFPLLLCSALSALLSAYVPNARFYRRIFYYGFTDSKVQGLARPGAERGSIS